VAGRYRALHQIVADVPDPMAMRTSAFRRAGGICRGRISKLALVNLEGLKAQSDEPGGAGESVATGIRAPRGMIQLALQ